MVRRGEERVPDDSSHLAARICTYVGGLPLAIEIAAHVALAHGYEQTLGMLEEGEVLSLRQEVSPARHRTLAAAISLAWQRLSGSEQEMLTKLAKAEALVPFDDAVANAGGRGSVESSTAAMIADLVSKSFLERIERGESLLWMLPSIRSFVRTATASERFAGPR
jgi:predicted ATPase